MDLRPGYAAAGSGADTVNDGNGHDSIYGYDGNDALKGNNGADRLDGSNGADALSGGSGADTLIGGSGNDKFVYNLMSDSRSGTTHHIVKAFDGLGASTGDLFDIKALWNRFSTSPPRLGLPANTALISPEQGIKRCPRKLA